MKKVVSHIKICRMMKRIIFFTMLFLCVFSFGQVEERLIDSVLVEKTGKTYQEYLLHFQKAEKEYEIEKNRIFKIWEQRKDKKNQLIPDIPNVKYDNEEFPFVGIINQISGVRVPLYKISKKEFVFSKIKKVEAIPTTYEGNQKFFIIRVE